MSSSRSSVAEYVANDYGVLNRHVDETYERVRRLTGLRGANVFARYMIAASIFVVAVAVGLSLVAFAYWLAFAPPRPQTKIVEIEKPVVVEKQVVVQVPMPFDPTLAEAQQRANQPVAVANNVPVVTNFTIFRSVDFNADGIREVVTGANYDRSGDARPSGQYCYVDMPIGTAGTSKHIQIARKDGQLGPKLTEITRLIADEAGTTTAALRRAQAMCQFI